MAWTATPYLVFDGKEVPCTTDIPTTISSSTAIAPLEVEWGRETLLDSYSPAVATVRILSTDSEYYRLAASSQIISKRLEIHITVRNDGKYQYHFCLFDGFVSQCRARLSEIRNRLGTPAMDYELQCTDHSALLDSYKLPAIRLIGPTIGSVGSFVYEQFTQQSRRTDVITSITLPPSITSTRLGPKHITGGNSDYIDIPEGSEPTLHTVIDLLYESDNKRTWVYDPETKKITPSPKVIDDTYDPLWYYGAKHGHVIYGVGTRFDWVELSADELRVAEVGFTTTRKNFITKIRQKITGNPTAPGDDEYHIGDFEWKVRIPGASSWGGENILEWTTASADGEPKELIQALINTQTIPQAPPATWTGSEFVFEQTLRYWVCAVDQGKCASIAGHGLNQVTGDTPTFTPIGGTVSWDGTQWEIEQTMFWLQLRKERATDGPTWSYLPRNVTFGASVRFADSITWNSMKQAPVSKNEVYVR